MIYMISGIFMVAVAIGIIVMVLIKSHQHKLNALHLLGLAITPFLLYLSYGAFNTNPKVVAKNNELLSQQTKLVQQQNRELKAVMLVKPTSKTYQKQHQRLIETTKQLNDVNKTLKPTQIPNNIKHMRIIKKPKRCINLSWETQF